MQKVWDREIELNESRSAIRDRARQRSSERYQKTKEKRERAREKLDKISVKDFR